MERRSRNMLIIIIITCMVAKPSHIQKSSQESDSYSPSRQTKKKKKQVNFQHTDFTKNVTHDLNMLAH